MFSQPINYPAPESLAIPSALVGEEMKSFRNCRNVIKSIPAASGSNVGPSSTALFSIPQSPIGFIKPGSVYLRAKVVLSVVGSATTEVKFAGNAPLSNHVTSDFGGASSLISRINLQGNGVTQSYACYQHYRNAVLVHCLTNGYISGDLRQLEWAGASKVITGATDADKTMYVSIPLWIGAFNSATAFPLCLLNSPIQLEILTAPVNEAFASAAGGNAPTNYALSEMTLVYEELQVEPSFVQALKTSKAGQAFTFKVNDYIAVGPFSPSQSERFQVGLGVSSLKSLLATEMLSSCTANASNEKYYCSNGLSSSAWYIDGQQVSLVNLDNEATCFAEMNKALQRLNDPNTTSFMDPLANTNGTGLRTSYTTGNFLLGTSTMTLSDFGWSMSGVPASVVTLELNHSPLSDQANRWGNSTAYASGANAYLFALYDAQYSIDISTGMLSIRK
jgi:hypothetical protein